MNVVAPHVMSPPTRTQSSTSRGGRLALGILVVYAVSLGIALLVAAPIDLRVELPLYGGDQLMFGSAGAALIGAGALLSALGAWLASLGVWKNGGAAILLGCLAPQFVTGSPVSLVLSVPTLVLAVVAATLASRGRRAALRSYPR